MPRAARLIHRYVLGLSLGTLGSVVGIIMPLMDRPSRCLPHSFANGFFARGAVAILGERLARALDSRLGPHRHTGLQADVHLDLKPAGPDSAASHCCGMVSRLFPPIALIGLSVLAGCGDGDRSAAKERVAEERAVVSAPVPSGPAGSAPSRASAAWDLVSSGEGVALVFPASGVTSIRLFCPAGQNRILINAPSFRPIASEERLTFGSGGAAEALVADTRGDAQRGGVSATGPVPRNLTALIGGPVSASYGAQRVGPHPAPPIALARDFVAACGETTSNPTSSPSVSGVSACLIQDGERLSVVPLRGVGTEPFWGVQIEGRCVIYSHPDDQQGTRVWTRYAASPGGGTWSGALDGRPFTLRIRAQPGCSDGMSDRRYPFGVELIVGGEQRSGCAEPR